MSDPWYTARHLTPVARPSLVDALVFADAEPWMADGLCAQTDPEAFFPDKGGSTREAKKTCRSCPVIQQCLTYALEHQERFGIWGGLSERERRKILRQRKDPVA